MNYIDVCNVEFSTSGKDTTCTISFRYKEPDFLIMDASTFEKIVRRFRKDDVIYAMNTISATARCKDGDEFDEMKGRWIAKDKATLRLLELDTKIAFSVNGVYNNLIDMNRKLNKKSLKKSHIIINRLKYRY